MGDQDSDTLAGIADVTRMTLRELDGIDSGRREQAIRSAFEHTIRNGAVAMSSQSQQPEFSDLPVRTCEM